MHVVIIIAISAAISIAALCVYGYITHLSTPTIITQNIPADVPIGTMVPYAGKDIPAGWIACDNASYPTTAYPQLFAKIGYTYGTDDTKFRVPDTRGVFMRGIDVTATRDTNRPAGSIQLSGTVPDTNSVFIGASASATGGVGYVPAPMAGQQNHVLTGAGSIAISGYNSNAIFAGTPGTQGELRDDGFHTSANVSSVGERRNGTYNTVAYRQQHVGVHWTVLAVAEF